MSLPSDPLSRRLATPALEALWGALEIGRRSAVALAQNRRRALIAAKRCAKAGAYFALSAGVVAALGFGEARVTRVSTEALREAGLSAMELAGSAGVVYAVDMKRAHEIQALEVSSSAQKTTTLAEPEVDFIESTLSSGVADALVEARETQTRSPDKLASQAWLDEREARAKSAAERGARALEALRAARQADSVEIDKRQALLASVALRHPSLAWAGELAPESAALAREDARFHAQADRIATDFFCISLLNLLPLLMALAMVKSGFHGLRSLGREARPGRPEPAIRAASGFISQDEPLPAEPEEQSESAKTDSASSRKILTRPRRSPRLPEPDLSHRDGASPLPPDSEAP